MKKFFEILGLFTLIIGSLSFRDDFSNKKNNRREKIKLNQQSPEHNWSVNEYGFLVFPSVTDLEEFKNFVTSKTHAQVQQYLQDSLGFSSLGAGKYSTSSAGTVSEEEAIDYVMSTSHIFQIQGIIMRPISPRECSVNWEFILIMTPANLNDVSYGYLENGTYDPNTMNKFATNKEDYNGVSLSQFVSSTPYGHEDTQTIDCPDDNLPVAKNILSEHNSLDKSDKYKFSGPNISRTFSGFMSAGDEEKQRINNMRQNHPFWGWSSYTCTLYTGTECWDPITNSPGTCYRYCPPRYYVFWICMTNCGDGACNAMQSGAPCPPTQQ